MPLSAFLQAAIATLGVEGGLFRCVVTVAGAVLARFSLAIVIIRGERV